MKKGILAVLLLLALLPGTTVSSVAPTSSGYLEGTVLYVGRPVAGARISAGGQVVLSRPNGTFTFPPMRVTGELRLVDVTVRAGGLGVWTLSDARVVPGDTLRVTAALRDEPVILRQPAPGATRALSPTASRSAAAATGDQKTPPKTIRVYVTGTTACDPNADGEVEVVDFKEYVKHVLPNEWYPSWPAESLRAGAMAAKSFAWYYVSRGGKWPGLGADMMDNMCDQKYDPAVSYASTDKAVDDTWNYRITRDDAIHVCYYRAGSYDESKRADIMSQWGSKYWADKGYGWRWILGYYYENTEISPIGDFTVKLNSGAAYTRYMDANVSVSAPPGATHLRLSNRGDVSAGVLEYGATFAYKSPIRWSLSASQYGGSTRNGTRAVYVQWRDSAGKWSAVKRDTIVLDTVAPELSAPTHGLRLLSTLGVGTVPVRLAWSGDDPTSGVGAYQLQQSTNGGEYVSFAGSLTNTTRIQMLVPGRLYRFRVRARDRAGNWSAWAAGRSFRLARHQETHTMVSYPSGPWTRVAWDQASGGYVKHAAASSARAAFMFTGSKVGWVSTRGGGRGMAEVWVDGRYVRTVDLHSPAGQARKVVFTASWAARGEHVLEVRVLGAKNAAASGTRVDVDAFVTLD